MWIKLKLKSHQQIKLPYIESDPWSIKISTGSHSSGSRLTWREHIVPWEPTTGDGRICSPTERWPFPLRELATNNSKNNNKREMPSCFIFLSNRMRCKLGHNYAFIGGCKQRMMITLVFFHCGFSVYLTSQSQDLLCQQLNANRCTSIAS